MPLDLAGVVTVIIQAWACAWMMGAFSRVAPLLGLSPILRSPTRTRTRSPRPASEPAKDAREAEPISEDSVALAMIKREMARDKQRFWTNICALGVGAFLAQKGIGTPLLQEYASSAMACAIAEPIRAATALSTIATLLWIRATLARFRLESKEMLRELSAQNHAQLNELGAAVNARADQVNARADLISTALLQLTERQLAGKRRSAW